MFSKDLYWAVHEQTEDKPCLLSQDLISIYASQRDANNGRKLSLWKISLHVILREKESLVLIFYSTFHSSTIYYLSHPLATCITTTAQAEDL